MKSFRIVLLALVVALLALPAAAPAKSGHHGKKSNAARLCKQLRADMGRDGFRAAYASKHVRGNAFGRCVKQTRHTMRGLNRRTAGQSVAQAQNECQTELAQNPQDFDSHYGTDEQDANDEGADDQRNDDFADCVDEHGDQNDQGDDNNEQGDDSSVEHPSGDGPGDQPADTPGTDD